MTEETRKGEIPSYRDATAGEGTNNSKEEVAQRTPGTVLGACWQAGSKGRCLPCTVEKPRFVIPLNKLEWYKSYMKDHALIFKFIGVWPSKKELTRWIQQKWHPHGHIELKLGAHGFFTVIFSNL